MKMIVGIDPSFSATGLVAIDETGAVHFKRTVEQQAVSHESISEIVREVQNFIAIAHTPRPGCVVEVGCEQPPYSKGASSSYQMLCALYGAIVCATGATPVNVSSWKSKVMHNGLRMSDKRSKQGRKNYLEKIKDKFGKHFDNTDTADAYCIAQYVLQGFTRDENT